MEKKNKKHKKRVLPLEWDPSKSKDIRRQKFEDDEEALSWVKLTRCEIDKFGIHLANDMEEEVLTRYKVKKEARCKYKGRGKPIRWVYHKVRHE